MTYSSVVTEIHPTNQQGPRLGTTVDFIVIHHAALFDLDVLIDLETGGKEVSSHIGIQDDRIAGIADEDMRAWSMADAPWDRRSLTVETCNMTGAPEWLISEESYHSLALVVADWCKRYSIPLDRSRIIGHGEVNSIYHGSYATQCPGGINMDRVVADAIAVSAGKPPATGKRKKMLQPVYKGSPSGAGKDQTVAFMEADPTQPAIFIGPFINDGSVVDIGDPDLVGYTCPQLITLFGPSRNLSNALFDSLNARKNNIRKVSDVPVPGTITITPAQLKIISDAVIAGIGKPLTAADIPAVADATATELGDRLDGANDGK